MPNRNFLTHYSKNMRKQITKNLKMKFIETLNELDNFTYEKGNPFLINIEGKQFYIFLKYLSKAYFKNSPDVMRVQLPFSSHFSKIINLDIPFVILGYDIETDTFVSWNSQKIKDRLNNKKNVSLYSRNSFQKLVIKNELKFGFLSNEEKIVMFKRESLLQFFQNFHSLFKNDQMENDKIFKQKLNEPIVELSVKKLKIILDNDLIKQLEPLIKMNKILKAIEIASNYYQDKHQDMTFKEWYNIIINTFNIKN